MRFQVFLTTPPGTTCLLVLLFKSPLAQLQEPLSRSPLKGQDCPFHCRQAPFSPQPLLDSLCPPIGVLRAPAPSLPPPPWTSSGCWGLWPLHHGSLAPSPQLSLNHLSSDLLSLSVNKHCISQLAQGFQPLAQAFLSQHLSHFSGIFPSSLPRVRWVLGDTDSF